MRGKYKLKSVPLDKFQVRKYLEDWARIDKKRSAHIADRTRFYVLKHRSANHPVVGGVFRTQAEAERDFKSISGFSGHAGSWCLGCGIGCPDEYEIVPCLLYPRRFKRLVVTEG